MIIDKLLTLGDNPAHDVDVCAEELARQTGLRFLRGETIAQLVRFEFADVTRYRVTADALRIRDAPITGSIAGLLKHGEEIGALEERDGWVRHKRGWSSKAYLEEIK